MTFQMVTTCPQNVDTIVRYFRYDSAPTFSSPELQAAFDAALGGDDFGLKPGDVKTFRIKLSDKFVNLILIGFNCALYEKALPIFRKATLRLGTILNELKSEVVFVDNFTNMYFMEKAEIARQFASTLPLCDYAFDKYMIKKADYTEKEIHVFANEDIEAALQEGANIAKGICIARDLVNEPAEVLTPAELANRTIAFGQEYGFEVEVFDKEACEEFGMNAFLAVGRASVNEPKLIVMRYNGGEGVAKGVIGKGLCYDSGGLFLKQGAGMAAMKGDMAGSAAVIGAMCSIAMNKLPKNVVTVVAACENLVDGAGYRNGDIVHTMAGKSVFVASTDAEGRLTLADAITYMIRKENVDSIIELSTLTGSCANFFSDVCCGVLTTDDDMFNQIAAHSDIAGEKYARLPHYEEYREFIKSDIADLYNSSTNGAGGICAGLFLDEFKEDKPFMHVDVAGVTFAKNKKNGYPKGGTGFGVKTVYHYIKG
ncbi:MAG: leucyl aminopeptidase [Lachnospiraceae bacterium]|nr:leucyl aminopeptidase [Lachnospiraceae bacterium]